MFCCCSSSASGVGIAFSIISATNFCIVVLAMLATLETASSDAGKSGRCSGVLSSSGNSTSSCSCVASEYRLFLSSESFGYLNNALLLLLALGSAREHESQWLFDRVPASRRIFAQELFTGGLFARVPTSGRLIAESSAV